MQRVKEWLRSALDRIERRYEVLSLLVSVAMLVTAWRAG